MMMQASTATLPVSGTKRKAAGGADDSDFDTHWSESQPPLRRTSTRSPVGVEDILMEEMVQVIKSRSTRRFKFSFRFFAPKVLPRLSGLAPMRSVFKSFTLRQEQLAPSAYIACLAAISIRQVSLLLGQKRNMLNYPYPTDATSNGGVL